MSDVNVVLAFILIAGSWLAVTRTLARSLRQTDGTPSALRVLDNRGVDGCSTGLGPINAPRLVTEHEVPASHRPSSGSRA